MRYSLTLLLEESEKQIPRGFRGADSLVMTNESGKLQTPLQIIRQQPVEQMLAGLAPNG